MVSDEGGKLEEHLKEIRRKAYRNILAVVGVTVAIMFYLGWPVPLDLSFSILNLLVVAGVILGAFIALYYVPLLHYRTETELKSDRDPDYYLERDLGNLPIVDFLEAEGWELESSSEDSLEMSTYPTFIHRWLDLEAVIEMEVTERGENSDASVVKSNGREVEKIYMEVESTEDGCRIEETEISLKRYSPAYLELLLLLLPNVLEAMEEAADEDLKIIDEDMEYSLKRFQDF